MGRAAHGIIHEESPRVKDRVAPVLTNITVEKSQIIKLASHYTSCAGCISAVKSLLSKPLSELRMLSGLVEDTNCPHHLHVRDAYVQDPHKTAQLLEAFPLSSVLKKVRPAGASHRCQLHRLACSVSAVGSGAGGRRGLRR
ncbi:unnamed protein product, partial [Discosporangium mesarthrocarpum]